MRLMKNLKKMKYEDILSKTTNKFPNINPDLVYKAIESLLHGNYIKLDIGYSNTYIYVS